MMASPREPPETPQPVVKTTQQLQQKQQQLPIEMSDVLGASLKLGAGAGTCGLLFGATSGIIRGSPVALFSLFTGAQWFSLASVFVGTKQLALARHGPIAQATLSQKTEASFVAGACSGAVTGAIFRGPRNIIPSALVFSLGAVGYQAFQNRWDASAAIEDEKKSGWSLANFVGMRKLSDHDYEQMLEEKILKLEANIALIDESIAALEAQRTVSTSPTEPQSTFESTRTQ